MRLADLMTEVKQHFHFSENPLRFEIVKTLNPKHVPQIKAAIRDFMISSHMSEGVDPRGFVAQTEQSIANATVLGRGGDFWLMIENDQVIAYVLAQVVTDIDCNLTYWVSQAWVRKDMRGNIAIKMAWQKIRERAAQCLCKHIIVVSSRDSAAYCRWLGRGWHQYATLLKEDL